MSLKVNPAKIHLGKDQNADAQTPADNQYHAEYLPSPTGENKPVECILPPETPVELNIPPLLNIDQTCVYQFPDIIPLPPTYNPPPFIPCACEKLEYTNDVTFTGAGEGTFLNIIAGGPNNCDSEDPAFCNVSLSGTINIPEACPEVTVDVDVTGKGASKTSSILGVPASDGCGIKITGEIETIACESFTSSGEVIIKGRKLKLPETPPAPGAPPALGAPSTQDFQSLGKIFLTSASTPECGVKIDGNVYIPCPDFTVSGSFTTVGQIVESNTLQISKAPDDCNIDVTGKIVFKNPCDLISSSVLTIPISGPAICNNTLKLVKTGCALSWEGAIETCIPTIDIVACQTLMVSPNPSKIRIVGVDPVNGGTFPENSNSEWDPVSSSSISLTASKSGSYGPCLLTLTGNAVIEACKKMEIVLEKDEASTSTLNVKSGTTNIGSATISTLMSLQNVHACKKKLIYKTTVSDLNLDLCNLVTYTSNITEKTIKITNPSGTELASAVLKPAISITGTGCSKTISLQVQDIDLQLAAGAQGIAGLGESVSADYVDACSVNTDAITGIIEEEHRLRIEINDDDQLELKGSLLTPCFTCAVPQEGEHQQTCVYSDIELNELYVEDILPTQCCADLNSTNYINLCRGELDFRGNDSWLYIGEAEGARYSKLNYRHLYISLGTDDQWVDLDLTGLNSRDGISYLDFDYTRIRSYTSANNYIDIDYNGFNIFADGTKALDLDFTRIRSYISDAKYIDIDYNGFNIVDGTKSLDFDFDKIKSYTSGTKYIDIDYTGFDILNGAKSINIAFDNLNLTNSTTQYIDIDYTGFDILDGAKSINIAFDNLNLTNSNTQYIDIDYTGFDILDGTKSINIAFDNLTLKESTSRYIDLDQDGLDIVSGGTQQVNLSYNNLLMQESTSRYIDLDLTGLRIQPSSTQYANLSPSSLRLQTSSGYGLFEYNNITIQGTSNYVDIDLNSIHIQSTGSGFGELTPSQMRVSSGAANYSAVYDSEIRVSGGSGVTSMYQNGFNCTHPNASLWLGSYLTIDTSAYWQKITICTGTGANAQTYEIYVLAKNV